jgi:hypothetical protein
MEASTSLPPSPPPPDVVEVDVVVVVVVVEVDVEVGVEVEVDVEDADVAPPNPMGGVLEQAAKRRAPGSESRMRRTWTSYGMRVMASTS